MAISDDSEVLRKKMSRISSGRLPISGQPPPAAVVVVACVFSFGLQLMLYKILLNLSRASRAFAATLNKIQKKTMRTNTK